MKSTVNNSLQIVEDESLPAYEPSEQVEPSGSTDDTYRLFINEFLAEDTAPPPLPPRVRNLEQKYFNMKPVYQDRWATTVYVLHFVLIALISFNGFSNMVYILSHWDEIGSGDLNKRSAKVTAFGGSEEIEIVDFQTAIKFGAFSILIGFFSTLTYFMFLQRYTMVVVYGSWLLTVALMIALSISFLLNELYIPGFVLLFIVSIFAFITFRRQNRIQFTVELLRSVTKVASMFPAMAFVGGSALIVQALWGLIWVFLWGSSLWIFADFDLIKENFGKEGSTLTDYLRYKEFIAPTVIYYVFSLNWTSQIINNVVFVTISGVYSTFYYLATTEPSGEVVLHSTKPTSKSLKRAMTTSFGSIVFGSMIITIAQTLVSIMRSLQSNPNGNASGLRLFLACCFEQIFKVIRDLIEFLNKYAFVQVATFGKSYFESARDTWQLIKFRGIDLVINDSMTNMVLGLGGLYSGAMTAGLTFLMVWFVQTREDSTLPKDITAFVGVLITFALFVGFIQFMVLAGIVNAGMATTFVCLAQDPQVLQEKQPELFARIQDTYTSVMLDDFPSSGVTGDESDSEEEDPVEAQTRRFFFSSINGKRDSRGRYVNLG